MNETPPFHTLEEARLAINRQDVKNQPVTVQLAHLVIDPAVREDGLLNVLGYVRVPYQKTV